jgi:hypothetical protein
MPRGGIFFTAVFDPSTAAVVVSAVLTTGGTIIVAILRLVPQRTSPPEAGQASPRQEIKIAVFESDLKNLRRAFDELRSEVHEMRKELRLSNSDRRRGSSPEP